MNIYDIDGTLIYTSTYQGKKLSILGDSVSTYAGYNPSGQNPYYDGTNCGVSSVNDTWWMKVVNALDMTVLKNDSWGGSRVTTTGGDNPAGCMTRCQGLGAADVVIVFMGINDFNNEVALGTWNGTTALPSDTTKFREAYAIMLDKMTKAYKSAEIWCATLLSCERNGATGMPEINANGVPLSAFNDAIREIAAIFGARVLEHSSCGITYNNLNLYAGDWVSETGAGLHPNAAGMSLIANNDIRQMDAFVRTRY